MKENVPGFEEARLGESKISILRARQIQLTGRKTMKKVSFFGVMLTLIAVATVSMAQQPAAKTEKTEKKPLPLVFTQALPLPGVQGRFDHFTAAPEKARIYLSALGNDTVEVIDTTRGVRIQSVTGLGMPQGVVYVPDFDKLFVANRVAAPHDADLPGKGVVKVFDASGGDLKLIDTIEFHADCDNLRYNADDKRVYVGFGDGPTAGLGMIDAATDKRVGEYTLGAHPESFQIEKSGTKIFVNIADDNLIAVVDRKTSAVTKWPLKGLENNFPMALDEADHRVFIGVRKPPRLLVLDSNSGNVIATLPAAPAMDDLYYDANLKRVYVPGEGYISVFQQEDADHYHPLANVPTTPGAHTAGFFNSVGKKSKGGSTFVLAVPARGGKVAEVWFYSTQE
jgi:DNA-binding beta-propeller fold protein YncE